MKKENIYKDIYTKEFEKLSKYNVKIYICTSLGIYENNNNQFYKDLKKKYNLMDKNDLLLSIDLENNNYKCRELYGIIDYLIANKKTDNLVVVAADVGATKRARNFASKLEKKLKTNRISKEIPIAIIEKRRRTA